MTDDPATARSRRRLTVVVAGRQGAADAARRALESDDGRTRELALGALARSGALDAATLVRAMLDDPSEAVRRRACDLAASPAWPADASVEVTRALRDALGDADPLVVEAACWSIGELGATTAVSDVAAVAGAHVDARAREAAVAALGAVGTPEGLPAVLDALGDRPAVRRRAVVALAAFDGDEVSEAIRRAASDRDWQVREVAEILLDE